MKLFSRTNGEPWAISRATLQCILQLAKEQDVQPEAIAAKMGKSLDDTFNVSQRDGVAIMPIAGPLFRYTNFFSFLFGGSSYERIANDFIKAIDNPDVISILIDFDSPGGEVNGCAELATLIHNNRGKKPILAYASGDCASGAYWIASACDEIITSTTASIGSIGVVGVYRGPNGRDDEIEIVSSQSPNKRLDPTSEDDREKIQKRIDSLADVFINSVATHRGITSETVKQNYGQGNTFIGLNAVERGLADRGGTLEGLIQELSTQSTKPANERVFLSPKETNQMDLETFKADNNELYQQILDRGFEQERKRINAVLNDDEAKNRQDLAKHLALNTDLSPESIQVALKQAPENKPESSTQTPTSPEQASGFTQVMDGIENPDISTAGSESEETAEQIAERIASYSKTSKGEV